MNLTMTPQVREKLDALKEQSDASSYVEVIRRALATYELLCDEKRQGRRVITRPPVDGEGPEREIVFY